MQILEISVTSFGYHCYYIFKYGIYGDSFTSHAVVDHFNVRINPQRAVYPMFLSSLHPVLLGARS